MEPEIFNSLLIAVLIVGVFYLVFRKNDVNVQVTGGTGGETDGEA
jgi:hypothetical protein